MVIINVGTSWGVGPKKENSYEKQDLEASMQYFTFKLLSYFQISQNCLR